MDDQNQELTPEQMLPEEQQMTETATETAETTEKQAPKEVTPAQRKMMLAASAIALAILLMGGAYYGGYVKGSYETRIRMEKQFATRPTAQATIAPTKPVSHTANPVTFSWPEYTNAIANISMKYPAESGKPYILEEDGKTRKDATGLDTQKVYFEQTNGSLFTFSFTPSSQTLDAFIASQPAPKDTGDVETLKNQLSISGTDILWYNTAGSDKSPAHDKVYFLRDKIIYVLETNTLFKPEEMQQILSSITFQK